VGHLVRSDDHKKRGEELESVRDWVMRVLVQGDVYRKKESRGSL
jgi:hypothetical protein